MIAKTKLLEMTVAAFEPGASRKGLTQFLIDLCKAEGDPDFLLNTSNLALYELDAHEADDVLDFAFSVVEAKRSDVFHFVSQQLTYSLLAGNFVFSEHLLERSSEVGLIPLEVWFCDWTDHTDSTIRWLKENDGLATVHVEPRFFDQFWKHMSSQGLIDLLRLIGRASLEQRILSMRKSEQEYCGGLARLIDLGRIPHDTISATLQALILARNLSKRLLDTHMTIEIMVFVQGTSIDSLTELFVNAVSVAPDHDQRRLNDGFNAIVNAKVANQEDRDRAWNRVLTARALRSQRLIDLGDGLEVFM